jgi:lysophospholipase L1-like esterase
VNRDKGFTSILILLLIILVGGIYFLVTKRAEDGALTQIIPSPLPSPTPYQFPYKNPTIPKNQSYRIIIVGDSIVAALGANANQLRLDLISHYPNNEFVTYNYGYPSTNILSLYSRLTEVTKNGTADSVPILKQGFELIIIESFGYNPLSEYPVSDGLKKQNEELEKNIGEILKQKPNVALAFLTPIAPDPITFGQGTLDLSSTVRKQWVEERVAYINNHRKFAEEKGIPVIDVFKASLKPNGEVNKKYISDDFIHPSKAGIELISKSIADYIFTNKVFPE